MEEKWYCASYGVIKTNGDEIYPDCDFFPCNSDTEAISHAKELASMGVDYVDAGHFELDLISVCRVDPEREWEEVETVWY